MGGAVSSFLKIMIPLFLLPATIYFIVTIAYKGLFKAVIKHFGDFGGSIMLQATSAIYRTAGNKIGGLGNKLGSSSLQKAGKGLSQIGNDAQTALGIKKVGADGNKFRKQQALKEAMSKTPGGRKNKDEFLKNYNDALKKQPNAEKLDKELKDALGRSLGNIPTEHGNLARGAKRKLGRDLRNGLGKLRSLRDKFKKPNTGGDTEASNAEQNAITGHSDLNKDLAVPISDGGKAMVTTASKSVAQSGNKNSSALVPVSNKDSKSLQTADASDKNSVATVNGRPQDEGNLFKSGVKRSGDKISPEEAYMIVEAMKTGITPSVGKDGEYYYKAVNPEQESAVRGLLGGLNKFKALNGFSRSGEVIPTDAKTAVNADVTPDVSQSNCEILGSDVNASVVGNVKAKLEDAGFIEGKDFKIKNIGGKVALEPQGDISVEALDKVLVNAPVEIQPDMKNSIVNMNDEITDMIQEYNASQTNPIDGLVLNQDYTVRGDVVSFISDKGKEVAQQMELDLDDVSIVGSLGGAKLSGGIATIDADQTALSSGSMAIASGNANIASDNANIATSNANMIAGNANIATENADILSDNANISSDNASITAENADVSSDSTSIESQNAEVVTPLASVSAEGTTLDTEFAGVSADTAGVFSDEAHVIADNASISADDTVVDTDNADIGSGGLGINADVMDAVSKNGAVRGENPYMSHTDYIPHEPTDDEIISHVRYFNNIEDEDYVPTEEEMAKGILEMKSNPYTKMYDARAVIADGYTLDDVDLGEVIEQIRQSKEDEGLLNYKPTAEEIVESAYDSIASMRDEINDSPYNPANINSPEDISSVSSIAVSNPEQVYSDFPDDIYFDDSDIELSDGISVQRMNDIRRNLDRAGIDGAELPDGSIQLTPEEYYLAHDYDDNVLATDYTSGAFPCKMQLDNTEFDALAVPVTCSSSQCEEIIQQSRDMGIPEGSIGISNGMIKFMKPYKNFVNGALRTVNMINPNPVTTSSNETVPFNIDYCNNSDKLASSLPNSNADRQLLTGLNSAELDGVISDLRASIPASDIYRDENGLLCFPASCSDKVNSALNKAKKSQKGKKAYNNLMDLLKGDLKDRTAKSVNGKVYSSNKEVKEGLKTGRYNTKNSKVVFPHYSYIMLSPNSYRKEAIELLKEKKIKYELSNGNLVFFNSSSDNELDSLISEIVNAGAFQYSIISKSMTKLFDSDFKAYREEFEDVFSGIAGITSQNHIAVFDGKYSDFVQKSKECSPELSKFLSNIGFVNAVSVTSQSRERFIELYNSGILGRDSINNLIVTVINNDLELVESLVSSSKILKDPIVILTNNTGEYTVKMNSIQYKNCFESGLLGDLAKEYNAKEGLLMVSRANFRKMFLSNEQQLMKWIALANEFCTPKIVYDGATIPKLVAKLKPFFKTGEVTIIGNDVYLNSYVSRQTYREAQCEIAKSIVDKTLDSSKNVVLPKPLSTEDITDKPNRTDKCDVVLIKLDHNLAVNADYKACLTANLRNKEYFKQFGADDINIFLDNSTIVVETDYGTKKDIDKYLRQHPTLLEELLSCTIGYVSDFEYFIVVYTSDTEGNVKREGYVADLEKSVTLPDVDMLLPIEYTRQVDGKILRPNPATGEVEEVYPSSARFIFDTTSNIMKHKFTEEDKIRIMRKLYREGNEDSMIPDLADCIKLYCFREVYCRERARLFDIMTKHIEYLAKRAYDLSSIGEVEEDTVIKVFRANINIDRFFGDKFRDVETAKTLYFSITGDTLKMDRSNFKEQDAVLVTIIKYLKMYIDAKAENDEQKK